MISAIIQRFIVFPTPPDCSQGLYIFPQSRLRRGPGHAETPFIVALNLCAQTERESPGRLGMKIPGAVRNHHGATRESNGHIGGQLNLVGMLRRNGERRWAIQYWRLIDYDAFHLILFFQLIPKC